MGLLVKGVGLVTKGAVLKMSPPHCQHPPIIVLKFRILSIAYNYVDEPEHEKHWIVQIEPRQFDATAEEEIDRQNSFS